METPGSYQKADVQTDRPATFPYLSEAVQQYLPDLTGIRTAPPGGAVGRILNRISAGAAEPSCSVELF